MTITELPGEVGGDECGRPRLQQCAFTTTTTTTEVCFFGVIPLLCTNTPYARML